MRTVRFLAFLMSILIWGCDTCEITGTCVPSESERQNNPCFLEPERGKLWRHLIFKGEKGETHSLIYEGYKKGELDYSRYVGLAKAYADTLPSDTTLICVEFHGSCRGFWAEENDWWNYKQKLEDFLCEVCAIDTPIDSMDAFSPRYVKLYEDGEWVQIDL